MSQNTAKTFKLV